MTAASTLTAIDAEALRTRSRADFVFESLRDAISDGRIAVGERVREEEIARNLGVSRTPVREALQRLHQRGLLVFGTGRGLTVAELSQHQVLQLYAMRGDPRRLGGAVRGPACERDGRHHPLPAAEGTLQARSPTRRLLVTLNRRFHQAIYEAAHNQYLMETLEHAARLARAPAQRDVPGSEPSLRVGRGASAGSSLRSRSAIPLRAEEAAREHIRQAQRTRFENAAVGM